MYVWMIRGIFVCATYEFIYLWILVDMNEWEKRNEWKKHTAEVKNRENWENMYINIKLYCCAIVTLRVSLNKTKQKNIFISLQSTSVDCWGKKSFVGKVIMCGLQIVTKRLLLWMRIMRIAPPLWMKRTHFYRIRKSYHFFPKHQFSNSVSLFSSSNVEVAISWLRIYKRKENII